MSQWDPNQVPPQEGYQYYNQEVFYNVEEQFNNGGYYSNAQYPQNYNQNSSGYYGTSYFEGTQDAFHVTDNGGSSSAATASTSVLTPSAKEFQPYSLLNQTAGRQNKQHGAVKKDPTARKKAPQQEYRYSWGQRNRQRYPQQPNEHWDETYPQSRGKQRYRNKNGPRPSNQVNDENKSESPEKDNESVVSNDAPINNEDQQYSENDQNYKFHEERREDKRGNKKEYYRNGGRYGGGYNQRSEDKSYRNDKNEDKAYRTETQYRNDGKQERSEDKYRSEEKPYRNEERSFRNDEKSYRNEEKSYRGEKSFRNQYRDQNRYYSDRDRERYPKDKYERDRNQDSKNKSKNFEQKVETAAKDYKSEKRDRNFRENWRSGVKYENRSSYHEKKQERNLEIKKKLDAASQRERLKEMVMRKLLECLVCCEGIRHTDEIWSCKQCFHILHLSCIIKWAQASKMESGWRCPACQNMNNEIPKEYLCFCNKLKRPNLEPGMLPHSCGELCGKKGRSCEHTCTLLCHPGPCPDCTVMVTKSCNCGSTRMQALCSAVFDLVCKNVCNKLLDCGLHNCAKICHLKECEECLEFVKQECHCGKLGRRVRCTKEINGSTMFECGDVCLKPLNCGNHYCQKLCHVGECDPCEKMPNRVQFCLCGQTKLAKLRTSCLEPIPCCDKVCNKPLKCGQPSMPHQCQEKCHEGDCPTCPLTTLVRCRCGHMDRELMCSELTTKADDARCQKRCTKKRQCTKHKCNQLCCIDIDHICPLICNHNLSCGLHRCEETCHRGRCPPCWRTSFEELYCECGSSVLYPPVACGTRPPPCNKPCSHARECGHDVNHNCHPGLCPPCTILTARFCYGNHEKRNTIPCHQGSFSCGLPCGKDMDCGRHKCIQPCHMGPCPSPCTQLCTVQRESCLHPCGVPCHEPPCPDTPCKQMVKVTCECGLRSSTRSCMDLAGEYQSIAMSQLASKMADIQRGQTVDISDIVSSQKKTGTLKTLECNEECKIVERNRKLTIGLQIRNPDLSSKLMPRYSDFLKQWAKREPRFCQNVHDKLTELVRLAKQSKQKSRSLSFESMNRDKRHFVHEYCEHFGVDSAAYDQEPNRNVVATAIRDKSWLPSLSLMQMIQRESGQRKVPGPVNISKNSAGKSESVSLNKLPTARVARPPTPPGEYVVDYFNDPPP